MIEIILYSYKNKNLRRSVDSILSNTVDDVLVHVYDQHPIDRSSMFSDVDYNHILWDKIGSPCELKGSLVHQAIAQYVMIMSDDVVLSPSWDVKVKNFIDGRSIMVSGAGVVGANRVNSFTIKPIYQNSETFLLSQYAVREFMFASKEVWDKFSYPYKLKYNGEEELLSLNAFLAGVDIYSGPSSLYNDLKARTIENLYVPFSRDHRYNDAIDALLQHQEFLDTQHLDGKYINRIPYINDDVSYDPYGLAFQDIDARKFISQTKAIY